MADRLAEAERKPEPRTATEGDLVEDYVRKHSVKDKLWAAIFGADEEESGIPPLDYEL